MKKHAEGFVTLVNDAKTRIQEIGAKEALEALHTNPKTVLLDVREQHEWDAGHAAQAEHLSKGVLERDIESRFPEKSTPIIMYCGGGFRSALTCDAAQRLGYQNVWSLAGGFRAMLAVGWETKKP